MVFKSAIKKLIKTTEDAVIPRRFYVAIMLFVVCSIVYMVQTNISVIMLAMVYPTDNSTNETVEDHGPRYHWSADQQSLLTGAYFYGYVAFTLFGGIIAERTGGRLAIGGSIVLLTVLTGFLPFCATIGFAAVFVNRFITGVLGGLIYPAIQCIISMWAPPNEKGKFTSTIIGGTFGTVVAWPMSAAIIELMGWQWSFYIPAGLCGLTALLWFHLVYNSPSEDPYISKEEQSFIVESQSGSISNRRMLPPIIPLLKSIPFWALLVLQAGNLWGMLFLITAAPRYMKEVLNFGLAESGGLASFPYLARLFSGIIFGEIGDALIRNNKMNTTTLRKSFCFFSHILPGVFLLLMAFLKLAPLVCVAVITLSLGFNGAATLTSLLNAQDLSPNYAGTIYGAINCVGTTAGFISPIIVQYFTENFNEVDAWKFVFFIGGAVYIVPAFVFICFGSGEVQKWNEVKQDVDSPP